jgi:hypothetical protein
MDVTPGVTINTSGHVANNLSVGGSLVVGTTNILNVIADLQNNDVTSFLYEFDGGSYTDLNLQHPFGINLAVTSNANPLSTEILLSMDTTSGVTINTSGHVANNLSVGGSLVVGTTKILNAITDLQNNSSSVNLSNYYTRTDTDSLLNTKQNNFIDNGGEGTPINQGDTLSRLYGIGGMSVALTINVNDPTDPKNYNIKIDGSELQDQINTKLE